MVEPESSAIHLIHSLAEFLSNFASIAALISLSIPYWSCLSGLTFAIMNGWGVSGVDGCFNNVCGWLIMMMGCGWMDVGRCREMEEEWR